jgi:calcineurin-like phosphoesterase family protein
MHKRAEHWTERYMAAGFESVSTYEVLELASRQVLLCHFPYQGAGDHTDEERYPEWRPLDNGMPLLHGHIHDLWLDRGSMFNVGVDVHDYRPVPVERIVTWVRALETGAEGRVWTLTG